MGGGGAAGEGGSHGGNGIAGYDLNSDLESQTKAVMRAMDETQPTEDEWDIFFGRAGGGMSAAIAEKMQMAHNVAKAQAL